MSAAEGKAGSLVWEQASDDAWRMSSILGSARVMGTPETGYVWHVACGGVRDPIEAHGEAGSLLTAQRLAEVAMVRIAQDVALEIRVTLLGGRRD